jgi:hypothetical protein
VFPKLRLGVSGTCPTRKGKLVLIEILIILVIIAVALFIWRNMAGRRI